MYVINEDDRGIFKGISNRYTWNEINYIETIGNVVRGNHYHKFIKELFYILEGEIEVTVENLYTKEKKEFLAKPNMVFIIDPYEVHTFKTLKKSKWINMLSHQLDLKNPDIFKV